MNDDIDVEDFDDQGAPADLEDGDVTEQPAPKRGGGALLKIVILFVVIAGGVGAYLNFKNNPLLHRILAQHGIGLPGLKVVDQHHAMPPLHPMAPVAAHVEKIAPLAPSGNSLPVVHEPTPSSAALSPPALGAPVTPAPIATAPAPIATAPSPISGAPPSPFSIPSQQPAAASQKSSGNTASLQMPAPMGMPTPEDDHAKNNAPAMPTIPVPAVNKIDVAPVQDTHTKMPPPPSAMPDMMTAPAPDEQAPAEQASVQPSHQTADANDDSAEVQKLKRKIKLLENTIKQLQQAPVVPHHGAHRTLHHRVVHNNQHVVHHHYHHEVRRHQPVAKSTWVLKAAQPGVAWISHRGSKVLHKVQPGDTLRGIGEVEFIVHDSSGHWVVVGTKGRISQ